MKKLFLLLPWVLLLLCCTENDSSPVFQEAGGPGSETTNGIVARVDGAPAAFAGVALRRVDQRVTLAAQENAAIQPDFYADSNGRFGLDSLEDKSGKYRITVVSNGAAYTKTLSAKDIDKLAAKDKSEDNLDTFELKATGSVSGAIDVPKGSDYVWVGVYGMDMLVKTDSIGRFSMPTVPSGDSLKLYFVEESFDSVFDSHKVMVSAFGQEMLELQAAGIVAISKGEPVPFATVAVRKEDASLDTALVSNAIVSSDKKTDANGRFELDSLKSGKYRLTVMGNGIAYSKVLSEKEIAKLDTVELSATGAVVGRVTLMSSMEFAYAGVKGLDVLVKTDENGNYVFPSLPVGDSIELYFTKDNMDKLPVSVKTVVDEDAAEFHAPSMLLQDFEDGLDYWYLDQDTLGSRMYTKSVKEGVGYDSTRKSKVFHGNYNVNSMNPYSWVLVGTNLKEESWNLSLLDSISFYAKGNGQIRVAVESWDKMAEAAGINLKAASEWMDLDSTKWNRFVLRPADLYKDTADKWSGAGPWNSVKGYVRQIHFFAIGGSDFYIDDIWLHGVLF